MCGSCAPQCSFVRSLARLRTHSRARGKVNDSMSQNDLVSSRSATNASLDETRSQRRVLAVEISSELSAKWVRACEKNVAKQHGAMTTVANLALARAKQRMSGRKQAMEAASLNFVCEYPVSGPSRAVRFW